MSAEAQFASAIMLAWQGRLEFSTLLEIATGLEAEQRAPLAIVLYQTWLQRSPETPLTCAIWFNLGVALAANGDVQGAADAYLQAIRRVPTFVQPRLNLGLLYERQGQFDKAIAEWQWIDLNIDWRVADNKPLVLLAVNHLGRVLEGRRQLHDALRYLTRSLQLEPNQPDVLHHWVYLRQKQCVWPVYQDVPGVSRQLMEESTSALAMICISDDPAQQLAAARRYVSKKVNSEVPRLAPAHPYGHRKIRIGYCSGDFCLHPVAMLTVEMLELHDREHFEIYGYCWSPEDGSATRQRVIAAMDHFERIHQLSDEEAARLIRAHEIDILIDLQGQTAGARANMLAWRPAPIQITYLGLPATTGLPSIDYVIADRFLIPEQTAMHYSEKPLYMPDVYQVSDRKRPVGPIPTRSSCGLPEQGFVFCSFNNNFKYTPEVFDLWMDILRRVPGSVLWLLADNPWAEANLRREAQARGIEASRLIFASRVAPENYLARYALADLFLDSFPFNAGTTANDALWMGCPVLTRVGRTFASRMAGALLTAAGLPELITETPQDYADKAVWLAEHAPHCQQLRAALAQVREQGVLFDTERFTRALEAHLQQLAGAHA